MNQRNASRMSGTLQYQYGTNAGDVLIDLDYRIVVSPASRETDGETDVEILDYHAVKIAGEHEHLLVGTVAGTAIEDLVSHLYQGCREFQQHIDEECLQNAAADVEWERSCC